MKQTESHQVRVSLLGFSASSLKYSISLNETSRHSSGNTDPVDTQTVPYIDVVSIHGLDTVFSG